MRKRRYNKKIVRRLVVWTKFSNNSLPQTRVVSGQQRIMLAYNVIKCYGTSFQN